MKKLIALALVLGVVGLANAGFKLSVDEAAKTVSVIGTAGSDVYLILGGEGAPLTNFVKGADAPSLTAYTDDAANWGFIGIDTDLVQGEVWVVASAPGEAYKTGTYLTASWTDKVNFATLYTYNELTGATEFVDKVVPEPMTMALLALGGLFVRRK